MKTRTEFWLRSLSGIAAVVALAIVLLKQSSVARLRAEQAELSHAGTEAASLENDNGKLQSSSGTSAEAAALREQNKDLPKLRNEARQLRRKLDEWKALKAENDRLKARQADVASGKAAPDRPPGFIGRNQLFDAGLATPEAALQTTIWAWSQGNFDRMLQCMTSDGSKDFKAELDKNREEMTKIGAALPGYRVVERNAVSADEMIFKVELMSDEEGTPMHVRRVGNEWKVTPD
jgi:hypothetical protein